MISGDDIRDMDDDGLLERREVFDRIRERFTSGTPRCRRVMASEEAAWFEYTVMLENLTTTLWAQIIGQGEASMGLHEGPSKPSQM